MAIYAYVGLPRQGKGYNVVAEQILPALRAGRRVVTNIPLKLDALRAAGATGEVYQIDQDKLASRDAVAVENELAVCTAGALCVFDEVWRYLPQGLTAKHVPPAWTSLFAEHGHRVDDHGRMMQIVLCTQDLSQIAAFARTLVERTFVVTKLTVIGATNRFRVDVYAGAVTGLQPPIKKRISEQFGTYDPQVFTYYVSRTLSEGQNGTVDESTMDKRASLARNPFLRFGIPLALIGIVVGLWRSYLFFFPGDPAPKPPQVAQASKVVPVVQTSAAARYRIAAIVRSADDAASMVLLDHCDGGPSRWVPWIAARCAVMTVGGVRCEWRSQRYEFLAASRDCRVTDEPRSAQIDWFPANAGGPREQVSVAPAVSGS